MQSVTAIISRERCGGGEQKRKKEEAIIRRREGTKEEWPKFGVTLYRLHLWNFMQGFFFLFFFYRVTHPVKMRHTSHIFLYCVTKRLWMRGLFARANNRKIRITCDENFGGCYYASDRLMLIFYFIFHLHYYIFERGSPFNDNARTDFIKITFI